MAAFMSPLASYGVAGSATLRPGTWLTQACRLWLCCAADLRVPMVLRTTLGATRRASLMACPNVSSRVPEATCASPAMLGVDMLIDLERCGIGCRQGELHAGLDGAADARLDGREVVLARESLLAQPR